ncbi:H-NS histone family protein [Burkholderia ubonensis]|uniref:H-NS histone family protein n=1 Tax=Burkholderia ubonensis TaxID=101571 RepID=UPI00358E6B72
MNLDTQLSEKLLEIHFEIEALNRKAKAAAIMQIAQLMAQYGILPSELKGIDHASSTRRRKAKYWNPETGQTWSGRGRVPKWLLGKDLDTYRIDSMSSMERNDSNTFEQENE